jgi:DNA-binding FadR family transcriptional regulator
MITQKETSQNSLSCFLSYLAAHVREDADRLPTLTELSQEMGISIASVREQLEVARSLKLVEVKPRTGIKPLPFSFSNAIHTILEYAIETEPDMFQAFSDLRKKIESAYWYEVVSMLTTEDIQMLQSLVNSAENKLRGKPVQIPQWEHRMFHNTLFHRLDNPFVIGLLESYWDLYEKVGLDLYVDLQYLSLVWQHHQLIVDALSKGDSAGGYKALIDHMDLLHKRPRNDSRQLFE